MKVKGFLLLILLVISSIGFSVLGVVFRDGIYAQYKQAYLDAPVLTEVFNGVADAVYPWSHEKPVQVAVSVPKVPKKEQTAQKVPVVKTRQYTTVDDSYFDDALFIGDSRMVGLSEYCQDLDDRATFYAKKSLTIYDIKEKAWIKTDDGNKITLWQALEGQQFSKIYIMVGINELGTGDENYFKNAYQEVVNMLRQTQPNAVIFINSIMHVSGEKNESDALYNNTNINIRNAAIKELADGQNIFYINVNEAVDDEEGNLNSEWTSDGIHLKGANYEPWHEYLLSHGILTDE